MQVAPVVYGPDAFPVTQTTVLKYWWKKYHLKCILKSEGQISKPKLSLSNINAKNVG